MFARFGVCFFLKGLSPARAYAANSIDIYDRIYSERMIFVEHAQKPQEKPQKLLRFNF
jgi:hypothetical protein